MRKFLLGIVATAAIAAPLAAATAADAATPSDSTCTPSPAVTKVTHTEYQWAALVAKGGLHWEYKWTATVKNPSTDILHVWVKSLDLTKQGMPQITRTVVDLEAKDEVTCSVTLPETSRVRALHRVSVHDGRRHVPHRRAGLRRAASPITKDVTVTKADGRTSSGSATRRSRAT